MLKSKKKFVALFVATLSLLTLGVAGFAQKHFMIIGARPVVVMQLSGAVERDSALVALDKTVVKAGEVLDWTIVSENSGNAGALEYKAVGHVPRGTTFVAGSAKAEGNGKAVYSIDGGKSFSAQPTIEAKQADGTVKRVPAPVSMYTEIRYEWSDPLAQGGKLSASYKVQVK